MADVEIVNEIDRYIAYPGQALSYMVGRLEIQRIRGRGGAALGDRFDIRAFHDVVLGNGPLPLAVLDEVVGSWVAAASPTLTVVEDVLGDRGGQRLRVVRAAVEVVDDRPAWRRPSACPRSPAARRRSRPRPWRPGSLGTSPSA